MEEKAKVYWCDFRAVPGTNLLEKLKRLMRHAGIETIDFDKKMAANKFILVNREIYLICVRITQKLLQMW